MQRDQDAIAKELLALRCRRGDRAALEELIGAWQNRLYFFIRQFVRDEQDAWDVLQQTWLRVLRGIGSLSDTGQLTAWLYRVARNTAITQASILAAYRAGIDDRSDAEAVSDADDVGDWDDADQVRMGLLKLSLPHREVLTLFFLEDLPIEAIAAVVGVASGTVKSRLHYAKRALRRVLEEEAARHE